MTFDGVNTYLYDAESRVCAVHGPFGMTGYQYDADGNRIGKGSITSMSCDLTANGYQAQSDYVLDAGGGQMSEMAVAANGSEVWQHTNVTAGGALIATYDTTGLHFYLNDALGTRRAQTDGYGVLEQTCQSLPFGDGLNCSLSNAAPTEHHFTGKERDAESGLDYFGARYYASNMGRFMSPDWSAKEDPVPYAKLDDPQSLNLYGYVGNNPLGRADADGHCCSWDEVKDFSVGVLKGTIASLSGGAFNSRPSSSDSEASLNGQMLGSAGVTAGGIMNDASGLAAIAGGEMFATPSGGLTLAVSAAGAGQVALGTAMVAGGTANATAVVDAMGLGSYTNTHESGKTYSGKGDSGRASDSAKRVEGETGDKHVSTDHKTADSNRQSFKDEHQRIQQNGGAGSNKNYNKIESPGKKYSKQDGSN